MTGGGEAERTGGCHCGAVRYRARGEPLHVVHCHCTDCRRVSGAPFTAWATYPEGAVRFEGEPRWRRSSAKAERAFCAACGSALAYRHEAFAGRVDLTLGTLDDPAALAPERHIFDRSRLPWVRLSDGLPRHPGWNLDETGDS